MNTRTKCGSFWLCSTNHCYTNATKQIKPHIMKTSCSHLQQTLFCVMTKSFSLAPCTATVSNTRKLFCDHFTDGALLQHNTGEYNTKQWIFWCKKYSLEAVLWLFSLCTLSKHSVLQESTLQHSMVQNYHKKILYNTVELDSAIHMEQYMKQYTEHQKLFCSHFPLQKHIRNKTVLYNMIQQQQ